MTLANIYFWNHRGEINEACLNSIPRIASSELRGGQGDISNVRTHVCFPSPRGGATKMRSLSTEGVSRWQLSIPHTSLFLNPEFSVQSRCDNKMFCHIVKLKGGVMDLRLSGEAGLCGSLYGRKSLYLILCHDIQLCPLKYRPTSYLCGSDGLMLRHRTSAGCRGGGSWSL